MRSQRSASNYWRYSKQCPAPLRTRDYSTPPTYTVNRPPSRAGSFSSFIDYSTAKNNELSRQSSRTSLYDSTQNLSRSSSRSNVDFYLGAGRLSRVDSYVNDLQKNYEYEMPATYDRYRSHSRPRADYTLYSTPMTQSLYDESPSSTERRRYGVSSSVRVTYEDRIGQLERSLSRERLQKDRIRQEYSELSNKLSQAMRQMELLRTSSYASHRVSHTPRTSVFAHFYPVTTPPSQPQPSPRVDSICPNVLQVSRPSLAYTLSAPTSGLETFDRWRIGNACYGGLYSKTQQKEDRPASDLIGYYKKCIEMNASLERRTLCSQLPSLRY